MPPREPEKFLSTLVGNIQEVARPYSGPTGKATTRTDHALNEEVKPFTIRVGDNGEATLYKSIRHDGANLYVPSNTWPEYRPPVEKCGRIVANNECLMDTYNIAFTKALAYPEVQHGFCS
jgi:hypothetical protein